jgi:DNA-binding NarL/FixJ family response regulator
MTAAQRRRARQIIDNLEERTRDSWQIALATPVMEPAELSALCRTDRAAAAALLASLDQRQLTVQAMACTAWINETKGFDPKEGVQTEEMLAKFQAIIANHIERQPARRRCKAAHLHTWTVQGA